MAQLTLAAAGLGAYCAASRCCARSACDGRAIQSDAAELDMEDEVPPPREAMEAFGSDIGRGAGVGRPFVEAERGREVDAPKF